MGRPLRKTSECRSPLSERWLAAQPPAAILPGLQDQLDTFRDHYNEHRPSRALQRSTPGQAYRALPKAALTDTASVTVIELRTGEIPSAHDIDAARAYWRNKQKSPGRWPGPTVT